MEIIEKMLSELKERRIQLQIEDNFLQTIEEQYANFIIKTTGADVKLELPIINSSSSGGSTVNNYPDYPKTGKFSDKMRYFDSKSTRGWRMPSRSEMIKNIEGIDSEKTIKYISQEITNLVQDDLYVRCKMNNTNRYSFYFKREWLIENGVDNFTIKPGYEPLEVDMADIPIVKRAPEKMKWTTANSKK